VTTNLGSDEAIDDGAATVGARGHHIECRDHSGHFRIKGGSVDVIGPADVSGLDGQVELVANVRTRWSAVGRRAVPSSGVKVCGVALPTVNPHPEGLGSPSRSLLSFPRSFFDKLGLSGLTIKLHRHCLAVQGPPCLDICPVDRDRMAYEELTGDGRPG
jgi:hypothetical protein